MCSECAQCVFRVCSECNQSVHRLYLEWQCPMVFLDALASLGSMLESESLTHVFEILTNLRHIFRVCSECAQSVLRVCSECVQSVFRVCSECVQSVFRVCSECAQSLFII